MKQALAAALLLASVNVFATTHTISIDHDIGDVVAPGTGITSISNIGCLLGDGRYHYVDALLLNAGDTGVSLGLRLDSIYRIYSYNHPAWAFIPYGDSRLQAVLPILLQQLDTSVAGHDMVSGINGIINQLIVPASNGAIRECVLSEHESHPIDR